MAWAIRKADEVTKVESLKAGGDKIVKVEWETPGRTGTVSFSGS